MKHVNVALFVPFEGCPNQCSFCNQCAITGKTKRLTKEDVVCAAEAAIQSKRYSKEAEIAFFGGSFTAIEPDYMNLLLSAAYQYVKNGFFKGIRISTRPDCIDNEILIHLKKFGVTAIELGAQSMSNAVLLKNRRGHTAEDTIRAAELIHAHSIGLGLQMMTGLFQSGDEDCIQTAKKLIELKPSTVRIYPTIVLKNTELQRLFENGEYVPQSLEAAVDLCSKLMCLFEENGIKVIRLGLHSGGDVGGEFVAGPFHPAFAELCKSKVYLKNVLSLLQKEEKSKNISIFVAPAYVSQLIGQKRSNIQYLSSLGYTVNILYDNSLKEYEVKINFN